MSCRGKPKTKQLECYIHRTTGKIKSGVTWIGRQSGKQGTEHQYGWGLFLLGIIGLSVVVGGAFLAQTLTVSNPTALDASLAQTTTWKDAGGNALADGATVSGVITVQTTIPAVQVAELASIYISWSSASGSGTIAVPYYVSGVEQYVYKSGESTPLLKFTMTPSHSSYATDMENWMKGWSDNLVASYNAYKTWFKASVPANTYTSETWSGSLDTLNLGKGSYVMFTCITWSPVGTNTIRGTQAALPITTPEPPSLSGASWHNIGAVWLSSLLTGEESESTGPQVTIAANATSGDPPLAVKFNSTVTPGTDGSTDFAYLWDLGDGQTSTEAAPVHIFTNAGTYNVKLTVTDAFARSDTKAITIHAGTVPETYFGIMLFFIIIGGAVAIIIVRRRGGA